MNTVVLDNPVIGQFVFKRIRDIREFSLTDKTARTVATKTWHNITTFIDNLVLLDKFKK